MRLVEFIGGLLDGVTLIDCDVEPFRPNWKLVIALIVANLISLIVWIVQA